jgi:hypothetical protein
MNWLRNFFITKLLKSLLDSLPLNGKKTYLGIAVIILTMVQYAWPDSPFKGVIRAVIELLKSMDASDILNMTVGSIITAIGLSHKWLKIEDKK